MTVLAGKLPALDSTDEIAVTEPMAKAFGLHPGSHMTWQFYRVRLARTGCRPARRLLQRSEPRLWSPRSPRFRPRSAISSMTSTGHSCRPRPPPRT